MPFVKVPERYELTMASLTIISMSADNMTESRRTIDLSGVTEVSAHRNLPKFIPQFPLSADDVHISVDSNLNIKGIEPLRVEPGAGEYVAALIRNAAEDAQSGNPLFAAPVSETMKRQQDPSA